MKRAPAILGAALLALFALAAIALARAKAHQRLGDPGIASQTVPGKPYRRLLLPLSLPGYTAEVLTNNETLLRNFLPADTSFRLLAYHATNGFSSELSVVLMGADRSSIHNPEICMPSQGWTIDSHQTSVEQVPMTRPFPYALTVNRIVSTKTIEDAAGQSRVYSGVYVYWFVDATDCTEKSWKWKIWYLPRDLVLNGVLERWAYVSLFASCLPGQEAATFAEMKKLIATAVPRFQLVPRAENRP